MNVTTQLFSNRARRFIVLSVLLVISVFTVLQASAQDARVQIIHNAADPAAAAVDVYVNGALALDDFAFRTATPYLDLPGGEELSIAVAPGTSASVSDALATFSATFEPGGTYVVIANGVLDPSAFAANPDGRETSFTLWVKENARETIKGGGVSLFIGHGATDAPEVDVLIRELARRGTLVGDAAYGDLTGYVSLPARPFTLDVTRGKDVVASFMANLEGLGGNAAVVLASGFLNPSANQDGSGFALIAVLADGTVVELPAEGAVSTTARVQIIHNAADPNVGLVDVYVNGDRALNDFAFRTATPYLDLPGDVELEIAVSSFVSTGPEAALATFNATFEAGKTYVVIANGVLDPSAFAANPDGRETGFTLWVKEGTREAATDPGEVQFFAGHAATDAPTVDVIARDVATLVDNAAYGDLTEYIGVPSGAYTLDVTPGDDNSTVVASFSADLSGLAGGAAVVLASGFLDPAANQNGAAFGVIAVLPNGTVLLLDSATRSVARTASSERLQLLGNYPNPFNPTTSFRFDLPREAQVSIEVFDVMGRRVLTVPSQFMPGGQAQSIQVDASALASGTYVYRVIARMADDLQIQTGRMSLVK